MEDKDIPNIFNGKREILLFPADSDIATTVPLGEVVSDSLSIIDEDSVQYSGYYDCPELRKSTESFRIDVNIDKTDMTQFGKIFGEQMKSQVDNAVRSSVIIQGEPYINRPKNLKYPNKKRARRIWKKWAKRFGVRMADHVVIPKAVISFKPEFKNNQLYNTVEIIAEKVLE